MPPFDRWRHELNDKLDRLGEEQMSKLRGGGVAQKLTFEDRRAALRSGETVSQHRSMPPMHTGGAGGSLFAQELGERSNSKERNTTNVTNLPSTTQIQFSQFDGADKQAFFAMLDETDMWLDDSWDAKSLLPVGHGICSTVSKARLLCDTSFFQKFGGIQQWICLKQVDIDEQNPPHDVQQEVAILQRLRNSNIVSLLAVFTETPDEFTTVYHVAMPLYPVLLQTLLDDPEFSPARLPLQPNDPAPSDSWQHLFPYQTYEEIVCSTTQQLVDAVAFLHAEKIAHRDLKPSNIMFATDGYLKVIDFGVAWCPSHPETTPYTTQAPKDRAQISEVGTGAYRAPELLFAPTQGYDAYQADVWSLGILIASFFTELQNVDNGQETQLEDGSSQEDDYDEHIYQNRTTSWEQALWPECQAENDVDHGDFLDMAADRQHMQRTTLFDASRGDICLAGDIFTVLGLPKDVASWPEAEYFQPSLDEFPFVAQTGFGKILDRLPVLKELQQSTPRSLKLAKFIESWLWRLLQLSAMKRPSANEVSDALRSWL
ncbi:hypothetical protein MPSI1_003401 [Malassezia psittaci]|uniref:Protein kinase domain-containing protein n=1 Tax=Malassezia psittaci TaxID=1821823 RepID=A0AAF0JM26_9BASI|nr:hypothetical protein MPSI1_003401 [Malassezia psittaci]